MYSVFIADDELIIRQGLKCIIDWEALGFKITGEAANGYDALNYIITNSPDLVLIDIRMPKMPGLEAVEAARKNGFKGKVIILSGYTDFKYAQSAIKNGVDYYLTKPLEEDELTETLMEIKEQLGREEINQNTLSQYRDRAKGMILLDILSNKINVQNINVKDINLISDKYQVVIYENYSRHSTSLQYRFSDLLKVTNESAYGRVVNSLEDIHISYQEALKLLQRRFFCEDKQHTIGFEQLPKPSSQSCYCLSPEVLNKYCECLSGYIQASKRNQVAETLHELEHNLYNSDSGIPRIKLFLTDLYLSIKEKISHLYHSSDIAFPGNAEIIDYINSRYYLYEIMLYFTEQFDMIIRTIGNPSSEGVMDDIIHYIEHNYMDNIKLETIAPLFGYNSSYLGKIFNKKAGEGFNVFVDKVRIRHSKEFLLNSNLKVYEISEKVGYKNVDYFHTKFKKYVNMSPAEFRKKNKKDA